MSGRKSWKDVRTEPSEEARAALEAELDGQPTYTDVVESLGYDPLDKDRDQRETQACNGE